MPCPYKVLALVARRMILFGEIADFHRLIEGKVQFRLRRDPHLLSLGHALGMRTSSRARVLWPVMWPADLAFTNFTYVSVPAGTTIWSSTTIGDTRLAWNISPA